jgi:ribosomal-protein-alanine N-acetyltransferase
VIETARLVLRPMSTDDADFVVELLNDEAFVRYIGDKGVRTREDARRYVLDGPVASYARHGHGLCVVELREGGGAMGICGVLKRDTLPDADLGFALLPRFRSRGYAVEAAGAAIADARARLGLRRLLAITSPDNEASIGLLRRLGFGSEGLSDLSGEQVRLFSLDL